MTAVNTNTNRNTMDALASDNEFISRHIGTSDAEQKMMLAQLGCDDLQALMEKIIPPSIVRRQVMQLPPACSEQQALTELAAIADKNHIAKSYIGLGYYDCLLPTVIRRNILENPAWYTAYTPYQAEISQGRLEALLNFQTMVSELSGLPIANASMLDEATAAAEAMTLAKRTVKNNSDCFIVSAEVHPHIIDILHTRAEPLGLSVIVAATAADWQHLLANEDYFAALTAYPATNGHLRDLSADAALIHQKQAAFIVAADILALTLLTPPAAFGADLVIGSTQRFGLPMAAGGPHAAFMACQERFKRSIPGRLVGISKDKDGNTAYRLALQTREQHIRRDKATSNICTAQVLPAVIASMYAVYHGPSGLQRIAQRIACLAHQLAAGLRQLGYTIESSSFFDTVTVVTEDAAALLTAAQAANINLCGLRPGTLGISLDETTVPADIEALWRLFAGARSDLPQWSAEAADSLPPALRRTTPFMQQAVFHEYHSETALLRYMRQLADKDLSLDRSMIPLGSCTMKLNATSEMLPITWPQFAQIHPFAPPSQLAGYHEMAQQLCQWLCEVTGYSAVSLEPNAGSQGELAGLLAIRAYHLDQGQQQRNICLIPASAHGTNPASAAMVGWQVVEVACDAQGNVDTADFQQKCQEYATTLAAAMITYPSTHGVFEAQIGALCDSVHAHGGLVYIDGANMNALVGLAAPGAFGGDVSHLNLHKTFCIPHGGGGPGVGPVCVVEKLAPYLPRAGRVGAVAAAALGNASVLPISWMYCRMMSAKGLRHASMSAILAANYISQALKDDFPTLYANTHSDGRAYVAHECILDLRPLKESTGGAQGISAEDVAKRLMDYGFHAPTLSFPVPGTLMVEPTESEPLSEIERFIAAMKSIRQEIARVESGAWSASDNPLKNAPHTAADVCRDDWPHAYSRETAAFPTGFSANKYWPAVSRVDNVYGDRQFSGSLSA